MNDYSLFLDCGAPSLYEKLSKKRKTKVMGAGFADRKFNDYSYAELPEYYKYLQAYIDFLKSEDGKYLNVYSNLDVISNPKLTMRNQRLLEQEGLNPIPVFHLGSDERYLKRYIDKYEYIAIGGLVPNPTSVLIPSLDRIWREYLTDKDGYPKIKVHGFACTSLTLMLRYPWYSVDSTSSQKLAMYGKIIQPTQSKDGWQPISISTRDIRMAHKVTPLVIEEIAKSAELFGMTIEELGESIEMRYMFNHLTMLGVVHKNIPLWPWRMLDRKSNGNDYFKLYSAGVTTPPAARSMVTRVRVLGLDISMSRLDSFFYRTRLKHSIDLKKEIYNENK